VCSVASRAAAKAAAGQDTAKRVEETLELRQHCPPAAAGQDSYTLLKFYNLSSSLLNSIFQVRVSEMYIPVFVVADYPMWLYTVVGQNL
jgi:hypothetical protein